MRRTTSSTFEDVSTRIVKLTELSLNLGKKKNLETTGVVQQWKVIGNATFKILCKHYVKIFETQVENKIALDANMGAAVLFKSYVEF